MQTPQSQFDLFELGVQLLGGPRAAAKALEISERTMIRLMARRAALHDGFLRDMATALHLHALVCRELEKRLNPLFSANTAPDQPREDGRRRRHRAGAR